jgi:outer membrane protein, heavy metal efflux system
MQCRHRERHDLREGQLHRVLRQIAASRARAPWWFRAAAVARGCRRGRTRLIAIVAHACVLAGCSSVCAGGDPGDPGGSALRSPPGQSGAVDIGGAGRIESVIPVGPGPSYPRVPRGITQPPEPFGLEPSLGIETLTPLPETVQPVPLGGRFGRPAELLPETAHGMTIDEAIEQLLKSNLELRAQEMEVAKARADVLTAGLRGNPLIYTDASLVPYGNFTDSAGGPTQYDANVTLPLDINNKRQRRIAVATQAQRVTEALFQDAVRLQIDNLYTAWADVLAARATVRFLQSGIESLQAQKQATEALVRRGSLSRSEVNNVEILIDSTDLTLLEARETYDDAMRTLAALIEIPPAEAETFPIRGRLRVDDIDLRLPPVEDLIARAQACRPDLMAFRLGVNRARSEVQLARANRFDDAFLLYQPMTAQEGLKPGDRAAYSWAMGVTVPLPVFNRNQGNIARAEHTVAQTRTQLASLERQVMLEVQRAEAAFQVTRATIRRIEEEILPAARENLELALRAAADTTDEDNDDDEQEDTIALLEAQRAYGDISRQYLEALVRHRRSMFRINTSVGQRVLP